MEHEWISWFWWIFGGVFSKNVDGWIRFLMVFDRLPKNGFTSLTKKWNQDFEVPGLNCFLQTDRVKIAVTVLLLLLDDESCFEKDGYQTCPLKSVKISEIRVFPIDCHAALSKTKSQKRVVILREAKRSRRIYWRTIELSFCVEWNGVAESTGEPSNCHSAWSETESQNLLKNHLIVILREAMRSRRI